MRPALSPMSLCIRMDHPTPDNRLCVNGQLLTQQGKAFRVDRLHPLTSSVSTVKFILVLCSLFQCLRAAFDSCFSMASFHTSAPRTSADQ